MFNLAELCFEYSKAWKSDKNTLDIDLIVNISKTIFNGNHEPFEKYKVVIEDKKSDIIDSDIILVLQNNTGKLDGVASIPIFYYVACVYDSWTVDKLRIAMEEIEADLKQSYLMLHFKKGILDPYFLRAIDLFNKNLSDEVKLFIKLR
jgi:hypothetical protein